MAMCERCDGTGQVGYDSPLPMPLEESIRRARSRADALVLALGTALETRPGLMRGRLDSLYSEATIIRQALDTTLALLRGEGSQP